MRKYNIRSTHTNTYITYTYHTHNTHIKTKLLACLTVLSNDTNYNQPTLKLYSNKNYSAFQTFRQSRYSYIILIRRHTYKCNTFSDVDFEAFYKSAYVPLWYSQLQYKRVSKGVASFSDSCLS